MMTLPDAQASGGDLVIVANRLPVRRTNASCPDEAPTWEQSPGGLVAALEPAIQSHRTTWIGWSGAAGCRTRPFTHEALALEPLHLSQQEEDAFYSGFSNSTIWPLYHDAIFIPQFHDSWWQSYVEVNQRFADRVAAVAAVGATVWIHDYQLQLVPEMVRRLRPDVRIGFFLHIPFPSQELFLRIPWRAELVRGMLGADVVGFQTVVGADNFRRVAERLLPAKVHGREVQLGSRSTTVGTYPVGIDAARIRRIASDPFTIDRAQQIRKDLGDPATVLLGVDRLDYTKGIDVRIRAYRELLEEKRIDPQDTILVQIAQPSRDKVPGYSETRTTVEEAVGRINGDFGHLAGIAVKYLHQSQSLDELVALYLAADVMLVTPFRDGMNLVAKEYVASRLDHTGVLVLSEFAGAAHQLKGAVLVNPFDVNGLKDAIDYAANGDRMVHREAMTTMARAVARHDAKHWAISFLRALDWG